MKIVKKIDVRGRIVSDDHIEVYQWLGYAATSPSIVKNAIAEAEASGEKEILVEINSGGGSVYAGAEIYYALKKFNGTVNVEIPSIAASAATFIAMAGHKVSMSIIGQFMIHGASTYAAGNHKSMDDAGNFLRNIDESIINAYLTKTSKTRDELRAMMDKDTWMTAQQALDAGFIDEILFANSQPDAVANHSTADNNLLPVEVIDKIKAEILANKGVAPEPINSTTTEPASEPGNNTKEDSPMNLETLQNEHPELFKQVKNMGYTEGVKAENARIKSIEEIAVPGNDALVNDAKYVNPVPAATFAINALKAQKEQSQQQLTNMQTDAQPLDQVPGAAAPAIDNEADAMEKEAQALADIFKGGE